MPDAVLAGVLGVKVASLADFDRWAAIQRRQPFPLNVTAEAWKPTRSNEQNAYLFGVCYPPIAEAKGYDVNDLHEFMCGTHFGWVDKPCPKTPRNPEGLESRPFRTTTRDENGQRNVLGTVEFSDFVETVSRVAAHVGVYIPQPNEAAA